MARLLNLVLLAFIITTAHAAPLTKRIAQVISDSTTKWEAACVAAGGGQQCNPISVGAFSTLLAAAGPCDQQNSADKMVDLAKQLNNDPEMIKFSQIFAQQPRNSPTSQSVPYCQQAPSNQELNGLFQCQFSGTDKTTFVGGIAVGGQGTIPLGLSAALNPAGSCPANPNGPVPDGEQLSDITQNPGVGNVPSVGGSGAGAAGNGTTSAVNPSSTSDGGSTMGGNLTMTVPASNPSPSSSGSLSTSFSLQNGKDAQALNAKFAQLNQSSTCTDGEQACVDNGFAQCVGGKFQVQPCSGGLMCAALPLVNKAGTSITCTTLADATQRIADTGAQGGLTGTGN